MRFFINSIAIFLLLGLSACSDIELTKQLSSSFAVDRIGKIRLVESEGFAGQWRLVNFIEQNNEIIVTIEDKINNQVSKGKIDRETLDDLWETLEANDIFELETNDKMATVVADAFGYKITVERDFRSNQFSVYAPTMLKNDTDEDRYGNIVSAILSVANPIETKSIDDRKVNEDNYQFGVLPIDSVVVNVMESFPVQLSVTLKGYLKDGCTSFHEIKQFWTENNVINIEVISKTEQGVFCTMAIIPFEKTIGLDGDFKSGEEYTLIVNGKVRKTFTID